MEYGKLLFVNKNHHPKTAHLAAVYIKVFFTLSKPVWDEGKISKKIMGRLQLSSGGLKSLTVPSRASWRC
jgi:hypothetical protein